MIAVWMGYAVLIGGLASVAALALERALRLNGKPGRMIWAMVIPVRTSTQ